MKYLSTSVDPECDPPANVFWGDDLDTTEIKRLTGLAIGKRTKGLANIAGCKRIKYISTTHWNAQVAEIVRTLPALQHLHVSRVKGVLADAGRIPSLKVLTLFACPALERLEPFLKCKGIESVWISGCVNFQSLEGIHHFRDLTEFEIQGTMTKCGKLPSLTELSKCKSLTYLSLATTLINKDLSPLYSLKRLTYLWLQNRFQSDQYGAVLAACPQLKKIELHNGSFSRSDGFTEDDD